MIGQTAITDATAAITEATAAMKASTAFITVMHPRQPPPDDLQAWKFPRGREFWNLVHVRTAPAIGGGPFFPLGGPRGAEDPSTGAPADRRAQDARRSASASR